jgi:hypothetical protein
MNDMVISVSTILAIIKCKVLLLNYNIDYFYKVLQSAYQVPHTMTREEKSNQNPVEILNEILSKSSRNQTEMSEKSCQNPAEILEKSN